MKIAVLGGAFNPPHFGHQLISRQVLDFTNIDEVWLCPCYKHTFNKDLASTKHRAKMSRMLVNTKIKYCHEEIKNKLDGNTINLLNLLQKKYQQHQFSFIIGSDNLKDFRKWGEWEKLITNFEFLVFPRPTFKYNLNKYGLDNPNYKFKLISHPLLITSTISSTEIRKRIQKGMSIKYLVPEKLRQYIETNNLYK